MTDDTTASEDSFVKTKPNKQMVGLKCPTVSLAGFEWPIPLMAPRQNRVIIPEILSIAPKVAKFAPILQGQTLDLEESIAIMSAMDTSLLDSITNIVYTALTRAHPMLTREEFDEWPLPLSEQLKAIDVIAKQTGMMKQKAAGADPLGEAKAE